MCGVVGYTGPEIEGLLSRMNAAVRHRGPDGEGAEHGRLGEHEVVHFGHRRLAVIDLERSVQPMWSEDGRWLLSYNGEIYNFKTLRAELEAEGAIFRTAGDTEVLLQALMRWGEGALSRLDGMFAFAACDLQQGRILLAVDRFGQKPLTWSVLDEGCVVFASELSALRCHPGLIQQWDTLALVRMMSFNAPPAPQTILRNVHRLEPGTALWLNLDGDGKVGDRRLFRWWKPDFNAELGGEGWGDDLFMTDLRESVVRHLVSDVPLGILLSGGVDSSVVAAAAAEHQSIQTLSMGFGEPEYNEAQASKKTAEILGSEHHEFVLKPVEALDTLEAVVAHLDEPLADASCLPTWLLYKKAREVVTVAVGGDGCDELLEGYPTFRALELARSFGFMGKIPGMGLAQRAVHGLPVDDGYYPFAYRLRRFIDGLRAPPLHRLQHFVGGCSPALIRRLVRPEVLAEADLSGDAPTFSERLFDHLLPADLQAEYGALCPENQDIWLHLRSYLAGEVLRKVDRMSMAHGLEVRAPLLGSPFAERCLAAPTFVRRKGSRSKLPLRGWLARSRLAHVAHKPKHGFAIPAARWLREDLRAHADRVFLSAESPLRTWCKPEELERIWVRHRDGAYDSRKALWALLILGLWMSKHG